MLHNHGKIKRPRINRRRPETVTLSEVLTSIRELSFDRCVVPAFAIKAIGSGYYLTVDPAYVLPEEATDEEDTSEEVTDEEAADEETTDEEAADGALDEETSQEEACGKETTDSSECNSDEVISGRLLIYKTDEADSSSDDSEDDGSCCNCPCAASASSSEGTEEEEDADEEEDEEEEDDSGDDTESDTDSSESSGDEEEELTIEAPTVSAAAGTYLDSVTVEITTSQEGAQIYYTIGDSGETLYADPIAITETSTLKVWAVYNDVAGDAVEYSYTINHTVIELSFEEFPTLGDIVDALIDAGIVVAYTPYFMAEESSQALIPVTDKELDEDYTVFRRYFFSDSEIKKYISWYYFKVLHIRDVIIDDNLLGRLRRPSEVHLVLWVSYYVSDRRRVYEQASSAIGQTYTDGSDYTGSSSSTSTGTEVTTVNIGSVFSITKDPTTGYFYEDYNRVGSDNVWGDRYSFWYRLQLYLRGLIEEMFHDYSLRKDNVIPGHIHLIRELDFRSYYDSYPFTLSPLSRGILSRLP